MMVTMCSALDDDDVPCPLMMVNALDDVVPPDDGVPLMMCTLMMVCL
jgi:hypothetical protein